MDTNEYLDMVCGLLAAQQQVQLPVTGSSMTPFLHDGDKVHLKAPAGRLKRGDIVLYTRPSGQYVLHRIVKANADGSFVMLGDAQTEPERIESRDRIHGLAVSGLHRGKLLTPNSLRWRFFATVWIWLRPWRRPIMAGIGKLKKKSR